jgi:cytochrome c-type biogenesis protein CcmE
VSVGGGTDDAPAAPLDLAPRPAGTGGPAAPPRGARWRVFALVAVVIAAVGFVLVRGLGDATLFFYNVDEAVAKQADLGERRFRLQGNVVDGTISRTPTGADFLLTYGDVEARVHHEGDLPQLFQPGIPVVLEGRWDGDRYASDRMLVKHSEVYTAEHPDRVGGYEGEPSGEAGRPPPGSTP